jgi:hypothetical protein
MAMLGGPEIVGEVTRQTVGEAVAAQGTLRRYVDRNNHRANIYLASWDAFHQAGFRAALTLQHSFLQAYQAVIEATLWATPLASERRSEPTRLWLDPTLKLSAGGARFIPGSPDCSIEDGDSRSSGWADSALLFPPPLGSLFDPGDDREGESGPA